MKKYVVTISVPDFVLCDQADTFIKNAIRTESILRNDGVLYLVDCTVDSSYNTIQSIPAGRHNPLILRLLSELKKHGLQSFFSNLIYAVFQFFDEENPKDQTKQGKIISIITDSYLQIKKILHSI